MSEQKHRGRLFILAGPSGVGKGTLRQRALADIGNLVYSISCTTRPPRKNERDGVDYRFISNEEFENRVRRGLFLEHACVHGNFYGTLRGDVERNLDEGHDVLLEIDVQGAQQVRSLLPESVSIFISPPSLETLETRLRQRSTESDADIALRLRNAEQEMAQASTYDRIIVNDTVEWAVEELKNFILSYRQAQ